MKSFQYEGHTYTFTRTVGQVITHRDDGASMWDTYPTLRFDHDGKLTPTICAYLPAIPTVREAQALIRGERIPTHIHRIVWAKTEEDAKTIRQQQDLETP